MIGAITGDIVGSIYEFNNIKTKVFPLFGPGVTFTDDSIMTLAVADALCKNDFRAALIDSMKKLAQKYPHPMGGYGNRFSRWVMSADSEPYNSWGNGSAMRVAACGFASGSLGEARELARISAEVTHNHPEAVAGAQVVASCIYLARTGKSKEDIKGYVEETYCKLRESVDEIRKTYRFTERCRDTVPPAIQAAP